MFGENKKDIVASVLKGSKAIISEETHLLRAGGFLLDLRVEGGHSLRALTHQVEANLQGRRRAHTSNQSDTQQHVKGTSQGSSSTVTAPRGRVKSAHAPRPRPPWKRGLMVHRASRIPCCPPAREAVALLKGDGSRGSTRVPQAAPGADRLGREAPMLQAEPSTDSPLWTAVCRRPPIFAPRLREICLLFRFWYQACRHGGAQMHVRARAYAGMDARARSRMRTHLVLQATSLKCPSLHLQHLGRLQDLHPRTRPSHPQTWPVLRPQVRPAHALLLNGSFLPLSLVCFLCSKSPNCAHTCHLRQAPAGMGAGEQPDA